MGITSIPRQSHSCVVILRPRLSGLIMSLLHFLFVKSRAYASTHNEEIATSPQALTIRIKFTFGSSQ